jgi:hypothetical protein
MHELILISQVVVIYTLISVVLCGLSGLIVWYATQPKQIKKVYKQYSSNNKVKYNNVA